VVGVHAVETLSTCCNPSPLHVSGSLTARGQGFKFMNIAYSVGNYYIHVRVSLKKKKKKKI